MEQKFLLPTEKTTALDRMVELLSGDYREVHRIGIRSIGGYQGSLPIIDLTLTQINNMHTIRAFPDGFEVMKTSSDGLLYDDNRKYVVDFFIL